MTIQEMKLQLAELIIAAEDNHCVPIVIASLRAAHAYLDDGLADGFEWSDAGDE